ncbi:hypothetical protein QUB29_19150 [Microcoleus sp. B4b_D2]
MAQQAIKIEPKDLKPIEHYQAFKLLWLGSDICIIFCPVDSLRFASPEMR